MKEMIRALLLTDKIKVDRQVFQEEPSTCVVLTVKVVGVKGQRNIVGIGFAKHNRRDIKNDLWKFNDAIGIAIASVRAVDRLVKKLNKMEFDFVTKWGRYQLAEIFLVSIVFERENHTVTELSIGRSMSWEYTIVDTLYRIIDGEPRGKVINITARSINGSEEKELREVYG